MDNSERNRKSRRRGCARNRRMYGGASYSFTGPLSQEVGGISSNTVTQVNDCGAVDRPTVNPGVAGIPGMSGGKRRTRRNNGRLSLNMPEIFMASSANNTALAPLSPAPAPLVGGGCGGCGFRQNGGRRSRYSKRRQNGGAYGFGTEIVGDAGIALGMRPQMPCVPNVHNSLNEDVASSPTNPHQTGGNSMAYYAPTAGYTNVPSDRMARADQVPFMTQVPYEARANNPACAKTGGRRKSTRKNRKSRRSKSSRRTKH